VQNNVREYLLRSRRVQCVAVMCCSVWQCVVSQLYSWASAALSEGAVCWGDVLQCVAVLRIELQHAATHHLLTNRTHHVLTNRCSSCSWVWHCSSIRSVRGYLLRCRRVQCVAVLCCNSVIEYLLRCPRCSVLSWCVAMCCSSIREYLLHCPRGSVCCVH